MELKERLMAIGEKVSGADVVCDIGTDHAYLPIYLIESGRSKRVIACDVKEGPVTAARTNVLKHNMEGSIEVRMGDGLEPVFEGEADVIIIAGMGGILIKDILKKEKKKAVQAGALILQPQNAFDILREWLYEEGFYIYDECIAKEEEKLYNVICVRWDGIQRQVEEVFLHIGEKLIENKDINLEEYVTRKIRNLNKTIEEMKNMKPGSEDLKDKYIYLRDRAKDILNEIKKTGGI